MARERIAFECGRKNIGLSRITKDEETQTSNKELNKLVSKVSLLKDPKNESPENFGSVQPQYLGPPLKVVSIETGQVISVDRTEMSLSI